ncbi:MAG: hypothetical protein ACREN8_11905, partial [Candidatus Dormibacteraceae bacterium]
SLAISPPTHSEAISPATRAAREILNARQASQRIPKLPKAVAAQISAWIATIEHPKICDGVNFSRIQINEVLRKRDAGQPIEFETLGPYLSAYYTFNGVMRPDNLLAEDAIGLQLAALFRAIFPNSRLVSLYDDYNSSMSNSDSQSATAQASFTEMTIYNFKNSLVELFKASGSIPQHATEGKEFLLIQESSMVTYAELLVAKLESKGFIHRDGDEISFVNDQAENPLHRQFPLRTRKGRWLCGALDAATYLKPENLEIIHIVVLAEYMRNQQDRVWEILRVLGIQPSGYHNIFYDPTQSPEKIIEIVRHAFCSPHGSLESSDH